jgi:glycosyltransferase involved in cell wall biosynthesis
MNAPRISIITPCYNMEKYIEQTMRSVFAQDYPDLEYIVVDGGSTDGTMDIINKYKSRISLIINEPDSGMYDAINKGFKSSTGEILAWLNADDIYFPWTLSAVAKAFSENNEIKWIRGIPAFLDESGDLNNIYNNISAAPKNFIKNGWFREGVFGFLQQESIFWKRSLWEKSNGLNLSYTIAADFELWTRFAEYAELVSVGLPLAAFRKRSQSKSVLQKQKYSDEVNHICGAKKKFFLPLIAFSKYSKTTNFILRLLIWRKVPVYYYCVSIKKWIFQYKIRPISNISFSQLLLENNSKNYT